MTNSELSKLLKGKSEEWRDGFFAAINLDNAMKAAFLRHFGQELSSYATMSCEEASKGGQ